MRELLDAVAAGRFPPADGAVLVHPQPPGPSAAVLAFTGHHVVCADVTPDWVGDNLDPEDLGAPMKSEFLAALGALLRRPSGALDVALVASGLAGNPPVSLLPLDGDHPRLMRARRFRQEIRAYSVEAIPGAVVLVGRGLAGRWESAFEVPDLTRGRGLGRTLARAAQHLVGPGEQVWAQVSPGNTAALRAVLAAGYLPVGAEVLFTESR